MLQGYIMADGVTKLTEAELQSGLRQAILSNPKYRGYIQEGLMFDKYQKFGAGDEKVPVEYEDIFGSNGLLNISEKEADKIMKEFNYNPDLVKDDPEMLEGLYNQIYMHKTVEGYASPASSAYSFTKEETKFLTDLVFKAALDDANDAKKQARKNQYKKDFFNYKKVQDAPITVMNQGAVVSGEEYNNQTLAESITETKATVQNLKDKVALNKSKGIGSASALNAQLKDAERKLAIQEGEYNGNQQYWLDSGQGEAWLDVQYDRFLKSYPGGSDLFLTKDQFDEMVKEGNNNEETERIEYTMPAGAPNGGTNYKDAITPLGRRNAFLNSLNGNINEQITTFVRENPRGLVGNVLSSADATKTGTVVAKMNTAKTNMVLNNRTNFLVGGGVQLDPFIAAAIEKAGDDGIEIAVAVTDMDEDGIFPDYITITNKKTGATISQNRLYSKTSNAENRVKTGIGMMKENKGGGQLYNTGLFMAASGSYPEFKTRSLEKELSTVNDYSTPGTTAESVPFYAGTIADDNGNINKLRWKVKKSREDFNDDQGFPLGTDNFYQLIQVDGKGKEVAILPSEDGTGKFKSINDMKTKLFQDLNPNILQDQYMITGQGSSSYQSSPVNVVNPNVTTDPNATNTTDPNATNTTGASNVTDPTNTNTNQ
jgi:hypothetical protein